MPSQTQALTPDSRSKRCRETDSRGSDPVATVPPASNSDSISTTRAPSASQRSSSAVKKLKYDAQLPAALPAKAAKKASKTTTAGAADEPITLSDGDISAIESDGDDGVSAVKASARTAAQLAGVQSVNGRRARFAQRFSGLSPEETLGKSSLRDYAF